MTSQSRLKELKLDLELAENHLNATKKLIRVAKLIPVGILAATSASVLLWEEYFISVPLLVLAAGLAITLPYVVYFLLAKPYPWNDGPKFVSYRINVARAKYTKAQTEYDSAVEEYLAENK
jgi:hypothetical protein